MSMVIGAGVVSIIAMGYLGRKSWHAFHKAVGITPGTMQYVEPSQLPPPEMIQLDLNIDQIQNLPPVVIERLQRIDTKADIYQVWRNDVEQTGRTIRVTEDEFVTKKLLNIRLPEVIQSYQTIVHQDSRLKQSKPINPSDYPNQVNQPIGKNQTEALSLMLDLLLKIEERLDALLSQCQKDALQDIQVMHRYLDKRDI